MNRLFRPPALAWLTLVVGAAWWIVVLNGQRIARIERIGSQAPVEASDPTSPTGYGHGTRGLLLPADGAASQAWIMEAQKMIATDSWRISRADYDNAPEGRPVHGPIVYRWCLRLVAEVELRLGNLSAGLAVERAALHADPALHVLLCLGAGLFVAWRFSPVAGGLLALRMEPAAATTGARAPRQPRRFSQSGRPRQVRF